MDNEALATIAYKGAIDVREKASVARLDPINIFDCAEKLKVEVRFVIGGTFEGMYEKEKKIIVLPVDRPAGRRVFTCAHELAHWRYKHGSMLDDSTTIEDYNNRPEEKLANMFAGYILMFPPAVESARSALGLKYSACSPDDIYVLASWFGVSYASMLNHLRWALRKLSHAAYEELKRVAPRTIRARLLGGRESQHLVVINSLNPRVPIDLEAGDFALLPASLIVDGGSVAVIEQSPRHTLVQAVRPGITLMRSKSSEWAAVARVMKRGYIGRSIFRNLEPEDDA